MLSGTVIRVSFSMGNQEKSSEALSVKLLDSSLVFCCQSITLV